MTIDTDDYSHRWKNILDAVTAPSFLLDRERLASLYLHFHGIGEVFYPVKANDHATVLSELARLGANFDVDTPAQIDLLSRLGVSSQRMQYGLPVRRESHLLAAIDRGVTRFVIDSSDEYERVSSKTRDALYLVRIAICDVIDCDSPHDHKWGISLDGGRRLAERIRSDGNQFLGLSFYLPKEKYSTENLQQLVKGIASHFRDLRVQILDIGGGLDDSSDPAFEDVILKVKHAVGPATIVVEPGRRLLDPAIDLLVEVVRVLDRIQGTWAYLDTGIYSGLLDAALKGRRFEIDNPKSVGESTGEEYHYILAGPTSDSLDTLGKYAFNLPVNAGDPLVIKACGAYTTSLTTPFSGFSGPSFYAL